MFLKGGLATKYLVNFFTIILAITTVNSFPETDVSVLKVGDETRKGTIVYKGGPAAPDVPDDWETVWDQWYPEGTYADYMVGSVWMLYGSWLDMKTADNFRTDPAYDDYVLAGFDAGFGYYYCTPDQDKGMWAMIWSDGVGVPASTEPYEFGLHEGWHDDLEAGAGGLNYAGIAGLEWADYWTYDNIEVTFIPGDTLIERKYHAHMEDADGFRNGEYYWRFDSTKDYWFCVQRYAGNG